MNSTWTLVIGAAVVTALAGGWFLMSHFLMDTDVGDAINESLGVAFGLLVLLSAIGAVRSGRGGPGPGSHP